MIEKKTGKRADRKANKKWQSSSGRVKQKEIERERQKERKRFKKPNKNWERNREKIQRENHKVQASSLFDLWTYLEPIKIL